MKQQEKGLAIGIDFDGTCVTHEFPEIGKDIGAASALRMIVENGHQLILFTMRSDRAENDYLSQAVQWFEDNNIPLYGINKNPTQHTWTASPKAYCHLYIDDAALGCPLKTDKRSKKPYVDWDKVLQMLREMGIV